MCILPHLRSPVWFVPADGRKDGSYYFAIRVGYRIDNQKVNGFNIRPWDKPSDQLAPIAGRIWLSRCHPAAKVNARSNASIASAPIPWSPMMRFAGFLASFSRRSSLMLNFTNRQAVASCIAMLFAAALTIWGVN
jgi:hypothetical protein